MATKPQIIDYQTKLCSNILQPLFDMTWDGLGETPEPNAVRVFIQAMPVDPSDGSYYVAREGAWYVLTPAMVNTQWGDVGGTLSNQTDLQAALDAKADVTYVDQQNTLQDADHVGLIIALG